MFRFQFDASFFERDSQVAYAAIRVDHEHTLFVVNPRRVTSMQHWLREHLADATINAVQDDRRRTSRVADAEIIDLDHIRHTREQIRAAASSS